VKLLVGKVHNKEKFDHECKTIDVFKFVLAFFVIAIHVKPDYYWESQLVKNAFAQILLLAVPFYFMSSGFLIASKFSDDPVSNQNVIKKQLKKVMILYIRWEIIYLPLTLYGMSKGREPISSRILDFIRRLLFVGELYNSWHLWYLLACIYAFVILLAVVNRPLSKLRYSLVFVTVLLGVITICIDLINYSHIDSLNSLIIVRSLIGNTIISSRVLQGGIFIPVGMLLYYYSLDTTATSVLVFVLFIFDMLVGNLFISKLVSTLYIVLFFNLIMKIRTGLNNSLILRKLSSTIYFIHMYVWTIVYMIFYHRQSFGTGIYLSVSIISTVIAFIWHQLKKAFNKS
jgi:hypothetical protein